MWPRLKMTREELEYCSKYWDPINKKPNVLRRIYPGELDITSTIRQDQETFQISRRTRIMALTAIGDIQQIEIQMTDIAGEQYTPDYISINNLILGTVADPRSLEYFDPAMSPATNGYWFGKMFLFSLSPCLFEPNIVQKPNQTLTINARPINPETTDPLHVDINLHVWEFPGMPGSPL